MSLFEGAVAQFIDANGKTRLLNFRHEGRTVSLMTSPLPPFDLPISDTIREAPIEIVSSFMQSKGLEVTRQDRIKGTANLIKGVWVASGEQNSPLYYAYIPVRRSQAIPDVEFADENTRDPLRVGPSSELTEFRKNRKTADYLKHYTLYAYSLDPNNFGDDSFEVIDGYTYDLEAINRRLTNNPVMFTADGRLKVPSEEIKRKLINYLKVQLVTDAPGVLDYRNKVTIDDYYQSLYDFRTTNSQLVFINKESLLRWRQETDRQALANTIVHKLIPTAVEPYYYRHSNVRRNRLAIVQNVEEGTLERALAVAKGWTTDQVNAGYRASPSDVDINALRYTVYNEVEPPVEHNRGSPLGGSVIQLPDEKYAALLFI